MLARLEHNLEEIDFSTQGADVLLRFDPKRNRLQPA
jgi:hypothetical protein